jgi:hypothetical protein
MMIRVRGSAGEACLFLVRQACSRSPGAHIILAIKTQNLLIDEIGHQPEPVQLEVLHFPRFLIREREPTPWEDVLPDWRFSRR